MSEIAYYHNVKPMEFTSATEVREFMEECVAKGELWEIKSIRDKDVTTVLNKGQPNQTEVLRRMPLYILGQIQSTQKPSEPSTPHTPAKTMGAPLTPDGFTALVDTVTWREGDYGEYAFASEKNGKPNEGTQIAKYIDDNGPTTLNGYRYTHKADSNFINRKAV